MDYQPHYQQSESEPKEPESLAEVARDIAGLGLLVVIVLILMFAFLQH